MVVRLRRVTTRADPTSTTANGHVCLMAKSTRVKFSTTTLSRAANGARSPVVFLGGTASNSDTEDVSRGLTGFAGSLVGPLSTSTESALCVRGVRTKRKSISERAGARAKGLATRSLEGRHSSAMFVVQTSISGVNATRQAPPSIRLSGCVARLLDGLD